MIWHMCTYESKYIFFRFQLSIKNPAHMYFSDHISQLAQVAGQITKIHRIISVDYTDIVNIELSVDLNVVFHD